MKRPGAEPVTTLLSLRTRRWGRIAPPNCNVRIETVSRLLGHADVRVTQYAYAELLDDTIRDEVHRALAAA